MKKTILIFTLLLSANVFAVVKNCSSGNCSVSELEAYSKDFRDTRNTNQTPEEYEAWQQELWNRERIESEARRDENMKNYGETRKEPGQQLDNCVYRFYEKSSEIVGYNVKQYVSVGELEPGKCTFDINVMADEMCDYFDSFSSLATPNWQVAEWCQYTAEKREITQDYHDVFGTPNFTDTVRQEMYLRLKPVEIRHSENIKRLFEIEQKRINQKQK